MVERLGGVVRAEPLLEEKELLLLAAALEKLPLADLARRAVPAEELDQGGGLGGKKVRIGREDSSHASGAPPAVAVR